MTDRDLMHQALDALETVFMPHHPAVIALRDRLAKPHIRQEASMNSDEAWRKWWIEKYGNDMPIGGYHRNIHGAFTAGWEAAKRACSHIPETYIPTMKDAVAAGDGVLMGEQAALLRECRAALDSLISQKPTLAGLVCGSTTLGNLRASMYNYRPQGIFGPMAYVKYIPCCTDQSCPKCKAAMAPAAQRQWVGLTDEEIETFVAHLYPLPEKPVRERLQVLLTKLQERNT